MNHYSFQGINCVYYKYLVIIINNVEEPKKSNHNIKTTEFKYSINCINNDRCSNLLLYYIILKYLLRINYSRSLNDFQHNLVFHQ